MTSMDPSFRIESPSAAAAAILDLLAAPRPWDLAATSKQLRKLLKAMQHSLQQNRTSASSDSRLVLSLQSLLHFGWDAEQNQEESLQKTTPTSSSPASPLKNKYIPPAARKLQQQQQQNTFLTHAPSSDSEGTSDAENGGLGTDALKLSRVRFLALACLQLLIKADPKAMHPLWPSLLPDPDTDLSSKSGALSSSKNGSNITPLTLAHPLLLDSSARVRHSAVVTLSTLLEGPAQRAYLAVAELRPPHHGSSSTSTSSATSSIASQHASVLRGFVPLSATLGTIVLGTHEAVLRALSLEQDSTVLVAILRALGTALVGTPYSRLPPSLLPQCVDTVRHVLQKAQHAEHGPTPSAVHFSIPILNGSLACLAAALGVKPSLPSLREYLSNNENGFHLAREIFSCTTIQYGNFPAVQLEALMALRGLTQQYYTTVRHLWPEILQFASSSVQTAGNTSSSGGSGSGGAKEDSALNLVVPITSSTTTTTTSNTLVEGGSSPREKVIQQSILLLGDFLRNSNSSSASNNNMKNLALENSVSSSQPAPHNDELPDELQIHTDVEQVEQKWIDAVEKCINPVIGQQTSPVLQAAGFGAIANGLGGAKTSITTGIQNSANGEKAGHVLLLQRDMRADLLGKCSNVLLPEVNNINSNSGGSSTAASPGRAAAAKAMASLIAAVPLIQGPSALLDALPSLVAACQDSVVAVRVQAAAALAAAADSLLSFFQNDLAVGQNDYQEEEILEMMTSAVYTLLPVAVTAATDGDKVKPSGVNALGNLLACRLILTTRTQITTNTSTTINRRSITSSGAAADRTEIVDPCPVLLEEERAAIIACISCDNAKVQWSACPAAGTLLETIKTIKTSYKKNGNIVLYGNNVEDGGDAEVQQVVEALKYVAEESNNSRTRALALAALAHCE